MAIDDQWRHRKGGIGMKSEYCMTTMAREKVVIKTMVNIVGKIK